MSTRCQIGFYAQGNKDLLKPDALLYRHSDGYPGKADGSEYGLLADLVPFLKVFHQRRGLDDYEYAAAWAIHHLCELSVQSKKEWLAEHPDMRSFYSEDGRDMLSHGVCREFHGDIEYYYAVFGPELQVYKVNIPARHDGDPKKSHFHLIDTIKIEREERAATGLTHLRS